MADSDKRLRYYNGQILQQEDFIDEQAYHLDRHRRHLRQLHTSGIAEGLTVIADVGAASVTVQPGTAIDNEGRPIVLVAPRTVQLDTLVNQWALVVISYREGPAVPATAGEGETRWLEDPSIEVIPESGAPPADVRLRLARLQLDNNGRIAQAQDTAVRTSAGVKLGTELGIERIRLSRQGVASHSWPVLSLGAEKRLDVTGDVLVTGTVNGRNVSADGQKLDAHTASSNNPHNTTALQVGAITGVGGVSNPGGQVALQAGNNISITSDSINKRITIASATIEGVSSPGGNIDLVGQNGINITGNNTAKTITITNAAPGSIAGISNPGGNIDILGAGGISITPDSVNKRITIASSTIEGVSNPGGNIDLVGQKGITVAGNNTAKTITITGDAGNLKVPNTLGALTQFVQDQNGNQTPLAIGTGSNVGIGVQSPGYVLTVVGDVSTAPIAEMYSKGDEASIRYVTKSAVNTVIWHAGTGGNGGPNNFFFWNSTHGVVATITPEKTWDLKGGLIDNGGLKNIQPHATAPVPGRLKQLWIDPDTGKIYRSN